MALPFIHIPKPCSENWDKMTPTACGRFCNVCQKEVIDLSVMDDATVTQTLTEKGGALCVRARADQVASNTSPVMVRSIRLTKLALFALALVCVFSCDFTKSDSTMGEIAHPKSKLMVKVVNISDKLVPDAKVELYQNGKPTHKLTTDDDGYGVFTDIPEGNYEIKASYEEEHQQGTITVNYQYAKEVKLRIEPALLGDTIMVKPPVEIRDSLPLE